MPVIKASRKLFRQTAGLLAFCFVLPQLAVPQLVAADAAEVNTTYGQSAQVDEFIEQMVAEHQFDRTELKNQFSQAVRKQSILDAISRPAEKTLTWGEYRNIFIKPGRISQGTEFWRRNREILDQVSAETGVPQEIIVAIIGVETYYGRHKGGYRVIDALSTLAFDYPPRSRFFTKELKQFLLLSREQKKDPLELKGSYAGAMGYGQFMPSSYRHYAKDFNGDEFIDIWNNEGDAIASVANYFVKHKWREGEPVVYPAQLDDAHNFDLLNQSLKPRHTVSDLSAAGYQVNEALPGDAKATVMALEIDGDTQYWMGLHNFYVITRYNHSRLYAMAVYELSQSIKSQWQQSGRG